MDPTNPDFDSLIRDWDGLAVLTRHHRPTGSFIFIALHDDTLGRPVGGTRLAHYPDPAEGLRDAMRLARGMTHKWAALEFDSGGGKAVLAVPEKLEDAARRALLTDYARLLESLGGVFSTGRDLGTTDDDMRVLAGITGHVHGVDRKTGKTRDPGPYTARGVAAAIRATLKAAFGTADVAGRSILVQGAGSVGEPLSRLLAKARAKLILTDIDEAKAAALAQELGATTVPAEAAIEARCDLYAPCARGATVNAKSIPRLKCRAIAGSANNQLAEDRDADRLQARGIVYAPDFIANGGGALAFGLIHRGIVDEAVIGKRLDGIEATLDGVFAEAVERGESGLKVALRRVEGRLGEPRMDLP